MKPRYIRTPPDRPQLNSYANDDSGYETVIANQKREIPIIPWDTSIRYMESDAYKEAYGDDVVWKHYKRNFKGHWMLDTREKCIRKGRISTGTPCPLCRDEYLVVDYRNTKLLGQFVNPFTGELWPSKKTGVCQKRLSELRIELAKAIDYGFMRMNLDFRKYDKAEYFSLLQESEMHSHSQLLADMKDTPDSSSEFYFQLVRRSEEKRRNKYYSNLDYKIEIPTKTAVISKITGHSFSTVSNEISGLKTHADKNRKLTPDEDDLHLSDSSDSDSSESSDSGSDSDDTDHDNMSMKENSESSKGTNTKLPRDNKPLGSSSK